MLNLPIIARATPTFMTALKCLFPQSVLTPDDQFLIELNSVFSSNKMYASGFANHPRYYSFEQRLPFEKIEQHDLTTSKNLNDIVVARTVEILNKNQPIKVFWSGGIDSTLVTASLLEHATTLDQLSIYLTCESIRENPDFFDHISKHNVNTVMWSDSWSTPFDTNDLIVTGTSSDEITGSLDQSFYIEYQPKLLASWQEFFNQQGFSHLIPRCEDLFLQSHSPIETVFDARWWFYFYIRHTYYARRDWNLNLENNFADNVVAYFNNADFDAWAVANKSDFVGTKYSDYKRQFKQATQAYWVNENYLNNKEKTTSYLSAMWSSKKVAVLGQQHLFVYKTQNNYATCVPKHMPFLNKQNILDALNDC